MRKGPAFVLALAASGVAFLAGRVTAVPRDAAPVAPGAAPGSNPPRARSPAAAPRSGPGLARAGDLPPGPLDLRESVAPLVDRVKASVVTIQSTKIVRVRTDDPWSLLFGGQPSSAQRMESLGSGFVLDRHGIVLTNNHVVAGADEVVVRLADDRTLSARVLGSDPATDVAVVKIDRPPADLRAVTLGDSDKLRVGDYVLAIGNPLGLGQTVTMGIVSAKNRVLPEQLGDMDLRYQDFIQTDAAINQGNSGGPLFNFRGEVVGINSAILNPARAMNVGFAIPINLARQIADQLRQSGRVARGFLGVSGVDATLEDAQRMGVPFAAGGLLRVVERGSPAEAAGLRPNDVVIEVGGHPVDSYRQLPPVVASFRPGQKVKIVFVRAGVRHETTTVLGGQPGAGESMFFGLRMRPLDEREAAAMGLRPGFGAAVVGVDPRGAASGTIEDGDVIVEVDRHPVAFAQLRDLAGWLKRGGRAVLTVVRGTARFYVQVSG